MSRSPKYSTVSVSAEVSQRLREEARRRAAERAARRAAEAARRREERLRQGQVALKERLAEVKGEVMAFDGTPAGQHVAEPLRQLRVRIAQMEQKNPGTEEDLARAEKDVRRLRREIEETIAQGEATEQTQALGREAATVLQWKRQAAADRPASRQFDPGGLAKFEAALRTVEDKLARRDLSGARQAMTEVGRLFEQHRAAVEKRRGAWLARKQAGEAALAALEERIAGLQSDPVVQRWEKKAVAELAGRAVQLHKGLAREQFDQVVRDADALLAETEQVVKAAEERQHRQEQQDYIAQSTVAALQECGFVVEGTSQSQQGASTETQIRAHRMDGRTLAVSVPQEGALKWSVDGFPMEVAVGSDGQPAAVCDEAVEQIEAIQARLDAGYGVETSALTWAGQDPRRPRKAAKRQQRPTSHNSQRTRKA